MNKKILLIEDEVFIAVLEKQGLEKKGYIVDHVTSGEDAIKLIFENNTCYDLLLMDIDLGIGIDGTIAAKEILNKKDIPIIFLSSHTEPEIVEKTENITSYGYVVKNSGFVVLDASIKMALKLFNEKMERKRAEKALLDKDNRLQKQNDIMLSIISNDLLFQTDMQKTVEKITEKCSEMIDSDRISVWLYSNNYSTIRCIDLYSFKEKQHTSGDFLDSNTFPSYIENHRKGKVIAAEDVFSDARTREIPTSYYKKYDIRSLLDSPVWLHGRLGAILSFENTGKKRSWTIENKRFAIIMATLLSLCFETSELKLAKEEIRKQNEEKDILLTEVNHRVKNNISSIESLLLLQIKSTENSELKLSLKDTVARVQTMRILYEKLLLNKNYCDISVKSYFDSLIDSIVNVCAVGKDIKVIKKISEFDIYSKKAISIGILLNELLTNIFKYAFQGKEQGNVSVCISKEDNTVSVIVQDDGGSIPEMSEIHKSQGLGIYIIEMIIEQLNALYEIERKNGTKTIIIFKI